MTDNIMNKILETFPVVTGIPEIHKFPVPTHLFGNVNTLCVYQFMSWEFSCSRQCIYNTQMVALALGPWASHSEHIIHYIQSMYQAMCTYQVMYIQRPLLSMYNYYAVQVGNFLVPGNVYTRQCMYSSNFP